MEHHRRYHRSNFPVLLLLIIFSLVTQQEVVTADCSLSENEFTNDPALQTMTFDLGYGPQEFRA